METQWWGDDFSPIQISINGSVLLCGQPMQQSYDADTAATLTLPIQPWKIEKEWCDESFYGCSFSFSVGEGLVKIKGVFRPRSINGGLVNFSGRIPIQKTYKFDASQVQSVATAYGYDLLAEDCETLASRLPVFLPSDNSILMQVHESAGIWLTVGGVVGGILGAIAGGIVGIPLEQALKGQLDLWQPVQVLVLLLGPE